MSPIVSVVMPCYNAADHVLTSVESVFGQSFTDIELVCVDDGSTDATREVLAGIRDPRLRVITQRNGGAAAARNRGLVECSGRFIAFLDSDDIWSRSFLEKMVVSLQQHPSAILAYCGWQNIEPTGASGSPYLPRDYEVGNKLENLLGACPWPIHAVLTRVSVFREVGAFNPALQSSEDYDLWLRIASRHEIVRVPEVLAYYIHHDRARLTDDRARIAINSWRAQRRFLRSHPELMRTLPSRRLRELVEGRLLYCGYECYWRRDLDAARKIFRNVMATGYGSLKDWKYMLPAVLPKTFHEYLIGR